MKLTTFAVTLALTGVVLVSGSAHAETLAFTITNPVQILSPGGTVEYDATVSAPATNTGLLYVNGDNYTVSSSLALDDSAFLTDFPFSLAPNDSYTGALFTISAPAGISSGTFNSSFQILGGATSDSQDVLGSQNFTTSVTSTTVTPEPSSLVLLATGLVGAVTGLRRRHLA